MDIFKLLAAGQQALVLAPKIQALFSGGVTGVTMDKVRALIPELLPVVEQIGGAVIPGSDIAIHAVVGAISFFASHDEVKGIQTALNSYLEGTPGFVPLLVDGKYGPATAKAVAQVQTKLHITSDGWFGKITAAALKFVVTHK